MAVGKNINVDIRERGSNIMFTKILRLLRRISRGGKGEGDRNCWEEYQVVGNFIHL